MGTQGGCMLPTHKKGHARRNTVGVNCKPKGEQGGGMRGPSCVWAKLDRTDRLPLDGYIEMRMCLRKPSGAISVRPGNC